MGEDAVEREPENFAADLDGYPSQQRQVNPRFGIIHKNINNKE